MCVYNCYMYVAYFSTFYNLLMNAVSIHQLIVETYTQLYIHLCMHKIPHSFDHCDCMVFRLYAKSLSTHGPNMAYCAIFLNKLVKLVNLYLKHAQELRYH